MIKVYLTKGLPGSGKTTWAKQVVDNAPNSYKRINKDDLRAMLDNSRHSDDAEKFVLKVRDQLILAAIEYGKHAIVDDTNLAPKHEARIRELIKGKAELVIQDFTDVPIEQCIKNDLKRLNSVGEKVIRGTYDQFLKPKSEKYEFQDGLPHAVICDLDGTLSLLNGRNPYDASTCDQDLLNTDVAEILKGRTVLLVSGREDKFKPQTLVFLERNGIVFDNLIMRKTDDFRKDWLIKEEIFNEHIRGKYNIDFVLDDRNRVVEMWRNLGLKCFQVADGNF